MVIIHLDKCVETDKIFAMTRQQRGLHFGASSLTLRRKLPLVSSRGEPLPGRPVTAGMSGG